jgi:hypothetical protein
LEGDIDDLGGEDKHRDWTLHKEDMKGKNEAVDESHDSMETKSF